MLSDWFSSVAMSCSVYASRSVRFKVDSETHMTGNYITNYRVLRPIGFFRHQTEVVWVCRALVGYVRVIIFAK